MTFYEVLTEAINDIMLHGFDTKRRIDYWVERLRTAARASLIPEHRINMEMEKSLQAVYSRLVTKGGLVNANVSKFTVDRLKPKLRAELDRRIMASADLIKYRREESINETLRRFEGWSTSIPKGGTKVLDKIEEKKEIRKALSKLPFEERRVIIDQTHKLIANINEITAVDSGAIAARWHSNWKQMGYNYREDHKKLDGDVYLIRDSWAVKKGFVKPDKGYTDEIISPSQAPFCRCRYVYLYNLRQVEELLTQKGKAALQSAKSKLGT